MDTHGEINIIERVYQNLGCGTYYKQLLDLCRAANYSAEQTAHELYCAAVALAEARSIADLSLSGFENTQSVSEIKNYIHLNTATINTLH